MTRLEHLLCQIAEECAEVAQRASKANRFGLYEVQPHAEQNPAGLDNRQRLIVEFSELVAVLAMAGITLDEVSPTIVAQKQHKVEHYLRYAATRGTLQEADRLVDHVFPAWMCGCGHVNGANLATCAMCGRRPQEKS